MKFVRNFGVFLIIAIAVATLLSIILPTKQHIEKSIVINATPKEVYEYLAKLSNFNEWSAWTRDDSSLTHNIQGTDGTRGAISTWKGHPEISGEGKMQIVSLEVDREVEHSIWFESPRKMEAKSEFDIKEVNGQTELTWQFDIFTPRPKNIFNLMSSLEKRMGKDFEDGLRNLKAAIEKNGTAKGKTYSVGRMDQKPTTYIIYRRKISRDSVSSFFETHLPRLFEAAMKKGGRPGVPTGLFFEWDRSNNMIDLAAALEVPEGSSFDEKDLEVFSLPGSKALYIDYYGPYEKTAPAFTSMEKYIAENKLTQKFPVIEQYITDPGIEKDNSKWLTKIVFLVD